MLSKIIYLTTCYRVLKDAATGFFSFIDVFDTVFIPKENDFIWLNFYVGGRFYSDVSGELIAEVIFIYPDGETASTPNPVMGTAQKGDVYFSVFFPSIKFTQIGKYKLKLILNGQELESQNEFYFKVVKQN